MQKSRKILLSLLLVLTLLVLSSCRLFGFGRGGQGVTPGYTRHEEGHWTRTDILRTADEAAVALEDGGSLETLTFAFPDGAIYTVEAFWLEERYYPSDSVSPGINVIRSGAETYAENVVCALYFAATPDGEPLAYFRDDMSGTASVERFSIGEIMHESSGYTGGEKYYLTPSAHFADVDPGQLADGDRIYLVLTASGGESAARIAWEYNWVAEPEDIEVPESYGPIEYFP